MINKLFLVALMFALSPALKAEGLVGSEPKTWADVRELRSFFLNSAHRLSYAASQEFNLLTDRRAVVNANLKTQWSQKLADFNSAFGEAYFAIPESKLALSKDSGEEDIKKLILKAAYIRASLETAITFFSKDSFASYLRSESNDQKVIQFQQVLSIIKSQIDVTKASANDEYKLSEIRNPNLLTLILRTSELNRVIKKTIDDQSLRSYTASSLSEDLQMISDKSLLFEKITQANPTAYNSLYNLQAELLSFTSRFAVPKDFAISEQHLEELEPQFEPGDVALIRHDLKLTNLGIRSNWSHAVLYIGEPAKLYAFFDSDPETDQTFKQLCFAENLLCSSFSSYLRTKFSDAALKYEMGSIVNSSKKPYVSIESLRPGVILSTLKSSLQKDRLAVLRPNLSKKDRALAVIAAFGYLGRPYDYRFDLSSDDKLICSELIYYSYQRGQGLLRQSGLEFPISYRGSIPLFQPKNIVQLFFSSLDDGKPAFSLVALTGNLGKKSQRDDDQVSVFRRTLEAK